MATIVSDLVSHLMCGEAISANDAVYIDSSDGKIYKFDPTDDTQTFAGIAKEAGVLNDFIRVVQSGRVKGFSGLNAGKFVYASTTVPGGFQLVEPAASQKIILGIAKSATELTVNGALGIKPGGDGGGGGLDVFYIENMEGLANVSDFATGNNTTFLGGGTLQGTLAVEDVAPISGLKSLKYTQAAGSLNDYFASPIIELDLKQRGNITGVTFYYEYDGNPEDIRFVVYDLTNSVELTGVHLYLQPTTHATRYQFSVEIPQGCEEIKYGIQVQQENSGAVLKLDDVEFKLGDIYPDVGYDGLIKLDSETPCMTKTSATALSLKGGTSISVGGARIHFDTDTSVIMPTLVGGTDYAVYVCYDSTVRASDNFLAPVGYNTSNSRKIGGFHYGLVSPTETVAGGQFPTSGNGMIWTQGDVDKIKGINEFSIWDLKFRPSCEDPRGMALVSGQFWADIYFCGTNHEVNGTSKAGTDVASGTVLPKRPTMYGGNGTITYASGTAFNFKEIAASHGKRCPTYAEFSALAYGTTENISLGGASSTIPITKREPRFTSKWGMEQVTGHHWTWGFEVSSITGSSSYQDATEGRGQVYGVGVSNALFGGNRAHGAGSGSRCSHWGGAPWDSSWPVGLRSVADHVKLN